MPLNIRYIVCYKFAGDWYISKPSNDRDPTRLYTLEEANQILTAQKETYKKLEYAIFPVTIPQL